ncbi:MAG: hypothetical protein QXE90_03745 [Candidatus Micrarchaeia archaeon]
MEFEISKYKNDPDLLIRSKLKRLLHLEGKLVEDMEKIKTPTDLFKQIEIHDRHLDRLQISIFRDIICMDMAKNLAMNIRLEAKDIFRMIKYAIDMKTARKMLEEDAVKVKGGVLFALNNETKKEIEDYFIKQIKEGHKELRLPNRFYK